MVAFRGQKRVLGFLELEWQVTVRCYWELNLGSREEDQALLIAHGNVFSSTLSIKLCSAGSLRYGLQFLFLLL